MAQQKDRRNTEAPYFLYSLVFWLIIISPVQVCVANDKGAKSDEYLMKAVCLYNFTQFTHWPAAKDHVKSESIVLGVVGESPFGDAIQKLQDSLKKQKKKITVIYHGPYQEGMNLDGSHLLFISSSEQNNLKQIVTSLEKAPVLTVSDSAGFLEAGGMISLLLHNNKVRWKINRTAIDSAGIQVRAKLLQLAIKDENPLDHSELLQYKHDRNNPSLSFQKALIAFSSHSLPFFSI